MGRRGSNDLYDIPRRWGQEGALKEPLPEIPGRKPAEKRMFERALLGRMIEQLPKHLAKKTKGKPRKRKGA